MDVKVRLAIYTALAGALSVLVVLGVITPDQEAAIDSAVQSALQLAAAVALVVAARQITPDAWSTLRVGIYATVSSLLVIAGVFGLLTPELSSPILAATDSILTVIGMLTLGVAAAKVPAIEGAPYDPKRDIEQGV